MLQAHLNVEAVRHWANPTHWGDTLLFFLRRLLLESGLEPLWRTRLRSFGAHDGVLSFRHDVHGMRDFTFLDYQVQNLIPASYDIEDPAFSTNISEAMAADWVARTSRHDFIEPALHNDSSIGDPPTAIHGRGPPRARPQRHQEPGVPGLHLRASRGRAHAPRDDRRDGLSLRPRRARPRHVHVLLLPHDRVRGAEPGGDGRRADRRQAPHLRHRRPPHDRHPGHLVPLPSRRHHRRRVAPAPRLGPHPRVRRRLRAGRDDLRRPQRPRPRGGRSPGERRLQLPVPPGAGPGPVGQRRARARSTTCATRSTWPSAATSGSRPSATSTSAWPTTRRSSSRCGTTAARSR